MCCNRETAPHCYMAQTHDIVAMTVGAFYATKMDCEQKKHNSLLGY